MYGNLGCGLFVAPWVGTFYGDPGGQGYGGHESGVFWVYGVSETLAYYHYRA